MSFWKKKALKLIPELKAEINRKGGSANSLFHKLLKETFVAHKKNETEKLGRYYQFAEWSFNHKEEELWNAAAMHFYVGLVVDFHSKEVLTEWIPREVYYDLRELLEKNMDAKDFKELDEHYYNSKRNLFQEAFEKNKK